MFTLRVEECFVKRRIGGDIEKYLIRGTNLIRGTLNWYNHERINRKKIDFFPFCFYFFYGAFF